MVAAIAVLAGEMWDDPSKCKPTAPVSVLHMQGTADTEIHYDGGTTDTPDGGPDGSAVTTGGVYPGATTSVGDWVSFDGCSSTADTSSPNLDIATQPGAETKVTKYKNGCRSSSEVQLWTIQGGTHIPSYTMDFVPDVFAYLLAHPKP
jgi:polyhydroxybutyrate depolymerase